MAVLAIDMGGSHVGCAVVEEGRVLVSSVVETDARSLAEVLPRLEQRLHDHCGALGLAPANCRGLGVGIPAIVDSRTNEILSSLNKYADGSGSLLSAWSERAFGIPARIENDARLALLGECSAGAGRGYADVVMITLGTGIGVAAMLEGRLLRSRLGQAGCLGGHITVQLGGRACACGGIGCGEAEASTASLPEICRDWPGFAESVLATEKALDFEGLFRGVDAGDPVAQQVLDRCILVWSTLAASLVHAYGPERMIFGGGVMRRADAVLPRIRAFVGEHTWKTTRGCVTIEPALLGDAAAFLGAETLFPGEMQ
jgi:glucokinase